MIINCLNCSLSIKRKPSEISNNNFCSRKCCSIYKKTNNLDIKTLNKRIKATWTNMNIRANNGLYKNSRKDNKNKVYENVNILFSREEFKVWCYSHKDEILLLERPSIDRIDSNGHYSLDNIRFIELEQNCKNKRHGSSYLNGPKSNTLRGIRKTKNGKWSSRITINNKEIHLGTFLTQEEAYKVFELAYIKHYNKSPWESINNEQTKRQR